MTIVTDPIAQALLIGSLLAAGLVVVGMALGIAIADERRAAGREDA